MANHHARPRAALFLFLAVHLLSGCLHTTPATKTPSPTETSRPISEPTSGPPLTPAPAEVWQTYRQADGLPYPSTTAVAADAGVVWVGTARGAAYFDGARWSSYRTAHGLLRDLVLELVVDPTGTVWFGHDEGVTRWDGRVWSHYTSGDGLPAGYVPVMAMAGAGDLWLGLTGSGGDWAFGNGVVRLNDAGTALKADDRWRVIPPRREQMGGDIVSAIADLGEAGLWFGVTPAGVVDPGSGRGGIWRLTGEDDWTVARVADGLPDAAVTALAPAPDGSLWVGTAAGLLHLPPADVQAFRFSGGVRYDTDNGLPSGRILALAVAEDGRLWAGTDAGLVTIHDGELTVLTEADGLADDVIRDVALAADGAVWIATPSGVSVRR